MYNVCREWIDQHLRPTRWNGDEATIQCPLPEHEDVHPSASANPVKGAWHCHRCGGGKLSELAERLGLPAPPLPVTRLFPAETIYQYRDERGELVFEVVRQTMAGGRKKFLQRHRDAAGRTVWKVPTEGRGSSNQVRDLPRRRRRRMGIVPE